MEISDSKTRESETREVSEGARDAGITAVLVVMVLFLRIMAVSGWDWDTAAELADAFNFEDAVPIFFGTLFELPMLTGIAGAIILPLTCYRLYDIYRHKSTSAAATDWLIVLILAVVLFVLVNSYSMWWTAALAGLVGAAIALFVFVVHKGEALELLDAVSSRTGTILVACILVLSVVVTTPWNPKEEITLADDSVVYGHVIEVEPGFVKVLDNDRKVRILTTGDVKSRETIEIPESGT
ncbi:hypothetical protein U6G28_00115 [Actinomycetaceae bacterium MB13-C1-2]|nr:hypothetical protein U6G28_00115 [Actinomycetaceae bacterium MB13-C1-2]